eukprot:TRINITY_DN11829_c0_g1_i1.p1 TRINITY_DN11829_c0_g1~~TRINITY_DN11829_c0_g1_i1.p1  ORF type:complete len:789 (-),score=311.69 TRINITY_DN11829_c0_g1_i1:504-2840(-)
MPVKSDKKKSKLDKSEDYSDHDSDDEVGTAGQWAQGLSKGVFAHKRSAGTGVKRQLKSPGKKTPRKRQKMVPTSMLSGNADSYLADCFASRSEVRVEDRVLSHNAILKEAEEAVDLLQKEVFAGVFDSIVQFAVDATKHASDTIPTAVLLTGVNMPDHTKVFSFLISKLEAVTPHVSLVGPGLALRALVQQMVVDLTTQEDDGITIQGVKKTEASLSSLEQWYNNQYPAGSSRPPLIIILQDFEGSAGPALQDLITLLRRYSGLPFLLVFGVATTITTVHRALSQAATARLTIHTFGSPPATRHLDQVIDRIIIDPETPFKLSHKVFQFLVENFLFHDFAVRHFMEGYKFILGEHFYRTPASALCCDLSTGLSRLASMTNTELDCVRRLPSFREMVEKMEGDEGVNLLVDPESCKEKVGDLMTEFVSHTRLFTGLVRALFHLVKDLPRKPLGKVLRDLYELSMKGELTATQQFREAWQFLKLISKLDLEQKLDLVLSELQPLDDQKLEPLISKLVETKTKLAELGDDYNSTANSCVSSPAVSSLSAKLTAPTGVSPLVLPSSLPPSNLATPLTSAFNTPCGSNVSSPAVGATAGKLDRFKLQQSLLAAMRDKNKAAPLRPFDIMRNDLLTSLHTILTDLLLPPITLPLHEIYLFSAPGAIRRHLVGAPRAALHTALTDPWEYLENSALKIQDPGEIPASLPDICIGYKLHLECPKLINLFDWLVCWNTIATGSGESDTPDPVHQARFARVVQELQHLGFIKTSTRKTDHVARLTFGGS